MNEATDHECGCHELARRNENQANLIDRLAAERDGFRADLAAAYRRNEQVDRENQGLVVERGNNLDAIRRLEETIARQARRIAGALDALGA